MLTRAVDTLKWLLVQQDTEVMSAGNLIHNGHQQLVVVIRQIGLLIHWGKLKLVWSNLVVAGLDRNTQLQTLALQLLHKVNHARGDSTKVVILQLLVLCRLVTVQCATSQHQVGTYRPEALIHQKILLLPAQIGVNTIHTLVEVVAHCSCCLIHRRDRAQQRHFIVQCFTRIGNKNGWDTECCIYDKCRRCWIPRRVTSRLECVTNTTIGERRSIRLLLCQHLTREGLNHKTLAIWLRE